MKKHWLAITISLIAVIALVIGGFFVLNRNLSPSTKAEEKFVETVQVKKSDPLSFNGISKSKQTQSINFNQAFGETINLEKQNGEAVSQGDLIAIYYSLKDYNNLLDKKSKVKQKKIEINNLKQDVQINSKKITALTNEVNQLNKEITKLSDAAPNKVYAELDGILTIPTSAGNDGMKPVAEISSNDTNVEIQVSEYDLSHIQKDQTVKLTPVDSGNKIKGTISSIAQRPDNTTSKISTYTVKITPASSLNNGNHVQVKIPLDEIKVPLSAVKEEDKKFYVYKSNGPRYTKKELKGEKKDSYFVVTSGLKNDESIVKNYKDAD
ncbi:efflux RND transporter periplasmic adaptor subunit [Xylocopilactobacillus apis]|uniref:Efflux RND transporter periplasmic adaptor subunit n=1 Tax=Xylocopilactobacillus apis TaxID=2932183 RepID=A0AAU9D6H7_9LACO|nr:efflux RND transporter periplasmic adaptor subunit [Xylocopilactobacillus apis]BDR57025.1 efflux RND transporter periplasmic adaptor subunit [Xylocopilactobacillus apis]